VGGGLSGSLRGGGLVGRRTGDGGAARREGLDRTRACAEGDLFTGGGVTLFLLFRMHTEQSESVHVSEELGETVGGRERELRLSDRDSAALREEGCGRKNE